MAVVVVTNLASVQLDRKFLDIYKCALDGNPPNPVSKHKTVVPLLVSSHWLVYTCICTIPTITNHNRQMPCLSI
jgi:hypothetical protein